MFFGNSLPPAAESWSDKKSLRDYLQALKVLEEDFKAGKNPDKTITIAKNRETPNRAPIEYAQEIKLADNEILQLASRLSASKVPDSQYTQDVERALVSSKRRKRELEYVATTQDKVYDLSDSIGGLSFLMEGYGHALLNRINFRNLSEKLINLTPNILENFTTPIESDKIQQNFPSKIEAFLYNLIIFTHHNPRIREKVTAYVTIFFKKDLLQPLRTGDSHLVHGICCEFFSSKFPRFIRDLDFWSEHPSFYEESLARVAVWYDLHDVSYITSQIDFTNSILSLPGLNVDNHQKLFIYDPSYFSYFCENHLLSRSRLQAFCDIKTECNSKIFKRSRHGTAWLNLLESLIDQTPIDPKTSDVGILIAFVNLRFSLLNAALTGRDPAYEISLWVSRIYLLNETRRASPKAEADQSIVFLAELGLNIGIQELDTWTENTTARESFVLLRDSNVFLKRELSELNFKEVFSLREFLIELELETPGREIVSPNIEKAIFLRMMETFESYRGDSVVQLFMNEKNGFEGLSADLENWDGLFASINSHPEVMKHKNYASWLEFVETVKTKLFNPDDEEFVDLTGEGSSLPRFAIDFFPPPLPPATKIRKTTASEESQDTLETLQLRLAILMSQGQESCPEADEIKQKLDLLGTKSVELR